MIPTGLSPTTLASVRASKLAAAEQILRQSPEPSPDEDERLRALHDDIVAVDGQLTEHRTAAEARSKYEPILVTSGSSTYSGGTSHVYRPDGEFSYFRDLISAQHGRGDAIARLQRNESLAAETRAEYRGWSGGYEQRAGTSGSATSFGSFIPPIWLLDEIANKARAGRVVPNLCQDAGEPTSTSITIPQVTTGTATAIQATENTTLGTTDIITAQLTRATSTIGGYLDASVQSVELSPMAIDRFVFGDLIADYNRAVDSQCIIGTGASNQLLGLDTLTGVNAVTYTDVSPTVGELYSKLADAIRQVHEARFLAPDAILMAPRRWAWILAASDTTGRPLVVPSGNQFNSPATSTSSAAFGQVGQLLGLPVFTDANIPTTLGAGTEDEIYVAKFSDMLFMEGPLRTEVFRDIGSANATVRFRVYAFLNLFVGRFPAAVSRLRGTGLISPTF